MSEEKMVTEREAIHRERAAFVTGVAKAGMLYEPSPESWSERANKMFPLPKVTRIREEPDPLVRASWSVSDGLLYVAIGGDAPRVYPRSGEGIRANAERVALWADLFANPTEEVEADA